MLSGGSFVSLSLTCAASTVMVHDSPAGKATFELSVQDVGPPLSANVCEPEVPQEIVNDEAVTLTRSLNVTVRAVSGCANEPFVGVVAVTVGAASMENENT